MKTIAIILKRMLFCALALMLALSGSFNVRAEEAETADEPQDSAVQDNAGETDQSDIDPSDADLTIEDVNPAQPDAARKPAEDIYYVEGSDLAIKPGETKKLKYELYPEDSDEIPKFTISQNESNCAVDEYGNVTVTDYGYASVEASISNGDAIYYSIYSAADPETIRISGSQIGGKVGTSVSVSLDVTPFEARYCPKHFTSSDPEVVQTGNRTECGQFLHLDFLKKGSAVITVTTDNGLKLEFTASGLEGDYADHIYKDDYNTVFLAVGETKQMKYRLGSSSDDRTEFADEKVTWTVKPGSEEYLKVNSKGEVTALQAIHYGFAYVNATITNGETVTYEIRTTDPVESISFKRDEHFVNMGSTSSGIEAVLEPGSAEVESLEFTLADPSIADIEVYGTYGRVVPKKAGSTKLTVTAPNGVSASTTLTVRDGRYADNIAFKIKGDLVLQPGESARLDYLLTSDSGKTDFSDESVTWSVSCYDFDAFTLKDGVITAHKENAWYSIIASISNGKSDIIDVDCRVKPESLKWDERKEYSLPVGEQIGLLENDYLSRSPRFRGHYLTWYDQLVFESDNSNVITVDEMGNLRALNPGTAVVTVTDRNFPDVKTTHTFKVGSKKSAQSVQFVYGPKEVCIGYKYVEPFLIKYSPEFADQSTVWTSSDPTILSLQNSTGTTCGFTVGTKTGIVTVIAASSSNPNVRAEYQVTVTDRKPSSDSYTTDFYISGSREVIRDGITYKVQGKLDYNNEYVLNLNEDYNAWMNITGITYLPNLPDLWSQLKNCGLFKVTYPKGAAANGKDELYSLLIIRPIKTGQATVKYFDEDIKIRVTDKAEYTFSLDKSDEVIKAGSQLQIKAVTDNPDPKITWKSSDEKIATVDTKGNVKGIKPGYATITATAADGKTAACKIRVIFTDVPASGIYYSDPVYWAVNKGITNGYTDSDNIIRTFKPQNNCTREAVVTFLWRLAGKPEPKSLNSPFTDVQDRSKYYYKAVLWAVEKGITKGYSDGTFKPNDTCLREHVVTFLYRYAGKPNPGVTKNPFNDVSSSDYYYNAALWANAKGIAKGYSDGPHAGGFGPKLDCLREHVVTFLYRYNNKYPK